MGDVTQFPAQKRQSITFVPSSVKAINELVQLTGDSETDTINRAVQVWAFLSVQVNNGKRIVLVDDETGASETVVIV